MRTIRLRALGARYLLIGAALLLVGAGAAGAAGPVMDAPDPDHGEQLAKRLCANCHLVNSNQTQAMADVPSFKEIANRQNQTEGAIMARIVIPKHPMPVIPITKPELRDLAAYIMSQRDLE